MERIKSPPLVTPIIPCFRSKHNKREDNPYHLHKEKKNDKSRR